TLIEQRGQRGDVGQQLQKQLGFSHCRTLAQAHPGARVDGRLQRDDCAHCGQWERCVQHQDNGGDHQHLAADGDTAQKKQSLEVVICVDGRVHGGNRIRGKHRFYSFDGRTPGCVKLTRGNVSHFPRSRVCLASRLFRGLRRCWKVSGSCRSRFWAACYHYRHGPAAARRSVPSTPTGTRRAPGPSPARVLICVTSSSTKINRCPETPASAWVRFPNIMMTSAPSTQTGLLRSIMGSASGLASLQ